MEAVSLVLKFGPDFFRTRFARLGLAMVILLGSTSVSLHARGELGLAGLDLVNKVVIIRPRFKDGPLIFPSVFKMKTKQDRRGRRLFTGDFEYLCDPPDSNTPPLFLGKIVLGRNEIHLYPTCNPEHPEYSNILKEAKHLCYHSYSLTFNNRKQKDQEQLSQFLKGDLINRTGVFHWRSPSNIEEKYKARVEMSIQVLSLSQYEELNQECER